jgi:hypothetical protein
MTTVGMENGENERSEVMTQSKERSFGALRPGGKRFVAVWHGIHRVAEALLGAFCGVVVVGVLLHCWNTTNWTAIRELAVPALWNASTKTAILTGVPAGIGCVLFLARSRRRRCYTRDELTREYLKALEHGDCSWTES